MARLVAVVSFSALATILGSIGANGANDASADIIRNRLGIGLHAGGGGIGGENADESELDLGGGGLNATYRMWRHWDLELSLGGLEGENAEMRRSFGIVTLGARYNFNPDGRWLWSISSGIGSADETLEVLNPNGDTITTREFRHTVLYFGGALERRFWRNRIGVSLELRGLGLYRDDDDLDGPEFEGKDEPIPQESSGGEIRLQATYYF